MDPRAALTALSPAARLGALLAVALVATASAVHAQSALLAQPAGAPERTRVTLGSRIGLAKSPFPSADAHEISGLLTSLLLEGEAQVGAGAGRAAAPAAGAGRCGPARRRRPLAKPPGAIPEAAVLWRLRETAAASLLGRVALAVPLPGGDAALARRPLDNQALVLASAQRGYHDQELYAPGRVALTPSARIDVSRSPVAVFGELKLPFMLAVARGDGDPRTNVRRLAIASAAAAGASVSWWRLRAGTTLWLVVDLLPAAEIRGAAAGRWTLTVDPEVSIRISDHVGAGLTATIPVAGALLRRAGDRVRRDGDVVTNGSRRILNDLADASVTACRRLELAAWVRHSDEWSLRAPASRRGPQSSWPDLQASSSRWCEIRAKTGSVC